VTVAANLGQFTVGGREGPVPLRKPKEFGKTENCEKDFIST